jgi:hypothetical protein
VFTVPETVPLGLKVSPLGKQHCAVNVWPPEPPAATMVVV